MSKLEKKNRNYRKGVNIALISLFYVTEGLQIFDHGTKNISEMFAHLPGVKALNFILVYLPRL